MKHSTFYKDKTGTVIYTTNKLTDHHKFLRNKFKGRTYQHEDNAKVNFIIGVPLDTPIPYIKEII